MIRLVTAFALSLMTLSNVAAQDQPQETQHVKVKAGDKAPTFRLPDHNGKQVSLGSLLKKHRHVAVVFHRSASW